MNVRDFAGIVFRKRRRGRLRTGKGRGVTNLGTDPFAKGHPGAPGSRFGAFTHGWFDPLDAPRYARIHVLSPVPADAYACSRSARPNE